MKHHAVLVMTMMTVGAVSACSNDDIVESKVPEGGSGGGAGTGGGGGSGGSAATAGSGGGGAGGSSGSPGGNGGTGGTTSKPPLTPALPADAPTVACPTVINAALEASDARQTGRHSRITPSAACGTAKNSPGTAPDSTNPHLYDVYRFANPSTGPVCFNFTLTYGGVEAPSQSVLDAGADASSGIGLDAGGDAAASDAGDDTPVVIPNAAQRYLTAYATFYPTSIGDGYLGDVGAVLSAPQTMGVTVPAGDTIDVVVYAIDVAPGGVGSYTLSCSTQ